ncbi:hypothetical protein HAX54_000705 [Datura stramonium]|uniref:Uncharacterized protein n=1 Tax=Datura stramonium TaxID=4076 RepID=A0ABS8WSV2_DATST|nr:hypothetical protein [Datura stramonium]
MLHLDWACSFQFPSITKALIPSLLMNVYVVGLNQLFDVEIDKVNKPNLPLASGRLNGTRHGNSYHLLAPDGKEMHLWLQSCIMVVRAIVVQFAFFAHIQKYVLERPMLYTRSLIFAVTFMCIFTAVIALFKDIPDVNGDRNFGIQSFSVSLGQERERRERHHELRLIEHVLPLYQATTSEARTQSTSETSINMASQDCGRECGRPGLGLRYNNIRFSHAKQVFWLCISLAAVAYGAAMVMGATTSSLPNRLVTVCISTV